MLMISIPDAFCALRLQERLRYYADQFGESNGSRRLSDTLREAADELDLTERLSPFLATPTN